MKATNLIRNTKGYLFVDSSFSLMLLAGALAIILSIIGSMIQGISLNSAATDVKRKIETEGKYDTSEQQKISEFLSNTHIKANVQVSPAKDFYQLGDTFIVTLSSNASIGAKGLSLFPITLYGRASGSCEVYHK